MSALSALRDLRHSVGLKQQEFAALLGVPVETLRTWDSGRRPLPPHILHHAKNVVTEQPRNTELVSLDQLAHEFGIHQRTLRAAARTGRLTVQFLTRSAFGRPVRRTTRQAVAAFKERFYRQSYSRTAPKPQPPDGMYVPV